MPHPSSSFHTPAKRPIIGIPVAQGTNPRGAKLYTVHQLYLNAIYETGGLPCPIPLHLDDALYREIFERLDGLLLAGGEDVDPQFYQGEPGDNIEKTDPERDRVELMLARWAVAEKMPILGICRGHQVLNVALGGSLYQDIGQDLGVEELHDNRGKGPGFRQRRTHQVQLDPKSKIARELGAALWVNSLHHQAVARPGKGLRVVGASPAGVIEATELEGHPFAVTVQWHPEMLEEDEKMKRLFYLLVDSAKRYQAEHEHARC